MPIFNYLWLHFSNKSVWKLIPYQSVVRPHFSSTAFCNLVLPINVQVLNETNWEDNNSQSLKNKNFASVLYQLNDREQKWQGKKPFMLLLGAAGDIPDHLETTENGRASRNAWLWVKLLVSNKTRITKEYGFCLNPSCLYVFRTCLIIILDFMVITK